MGLAVTSLFSTMKHGVTPVIFSQRTVRGQLSPRLVLTQVLSSQHPVCLLELQLRGDNTVPGTRE